MRELSSSSARMLEGTEDASYPFWSPDGESIGFFAGGELRRIDLRGGAPRRVAIAPYGRGGSWGRDGKILFAPVPKGASILMVDADGGAAKPVTKLDPSTENTHRWPVFLPTAVPRGASGGDPRQGLLFSGADLCGRDEGRLDDLGRRRGVGPRPRLGDWPRLVEGR